MRIERAESQAMQCHELLGGLNEYVDGETRSALCRAIQEHLADCTPCRIVIDNIRQTITLYRSGEAIPLPEGLHERIRAILRQQWAAKFARPVSL
jgi:predicted anti-sigma-YlaC factor YlaD